MFKKGSYLYYAMGNGMFYFSFGTFASIISVVLAGKDCTATEISLITSAAALFSMVFQPLSGFFADKFRSPQRVGQICLAMAIVFGILFGYSQSFVFLFLMNGFTQGFLNGTTALSDRLAIASSYKFGTIRVWGSIMFAIAAQLAGFVYDNVSPIAIYYIFAVAVLMTIIGFQGMIDVVPKSEGEHDKVTSKEVFHALIHNKQYLLFVAILCLYQGSFTAQFTYFPLFMKELGGTTTMVGTTILLSTLSEIPSVLFSDRFIAKFSYRKLMIFACVLTIVRFFWYATLPDPRLIMIVFFWQGLTSIVFVLVAVRIIVDIVDEKYVNSAYGVSNMMSKGLVSLIFMIGAGRIIDIFEGARGYSIIYFISAIVAIVALLLTLGFKDTKE